MLAKRLPSILPDMSFEEMVETTKIHSIAGSFLPVLLSSEPARFARRTTQFPPRVSRRRHDPPPRRTLARPQWRFVSGRAIRNSARRHGGSAPTN